jgi:hypothetical protein
MRSLPKVIAMDDYNFLADLLDTFQSSSDYIKTVIILTPPVFRARHRSPAHAPSSANMADKERMRTLSPSRQLTPTLNKWTVSRGLRMSRRNDERHLQLTGTLRRHSRTRRRWNGALRPAPVRGQARDVRCSSRLQRQAHVIRQSAGAYVDRITKTLACTIVSQECVLLFGGQFPCASDHETRSWGEFERLSPLKMSHSTPTERRWHKE